MLKGGLVSIEAAMGSLKPMERRVAQYILEHPEEVSELADIQLFISTLEKSIRSGAMASRIAQLNIDILYAGIAGRHYDESVKSLEKTRQAVKAGKRDG